MMLTLTLVAGLLAAPEPQPAPQKGWVVELRGYTNHGPAKSKGRLIELLGVTKQPQRAEPPQGKPWNIEVRGYSYQLKQPRKEFIIELLKQPRKEFVIEFQWQKVKPQPERGKGQYQPVQGHYHDDLSAFCKQANRQIQVEAVETFYVDDLRAYFQRLKKR